MTLRARLTLFFVLIVVVPLMGAGLVVRSLVASEIDRRADARLASAAAAVAALRAERLDRATDAMRRGAADVAQRRLRLATIRPATGLDFLVLADTLGHPLDADLRMSSFDVLIPSAEGIAGATPPAGIDRISVPLPGGLVLYGGLFADRSFAQSLAKAGRSGVLIWAGGRVIASSGRPPAGIAVRESSVAVGDQRVQFLPGTDGVGSERIAVYVPREGSLKGVERLFELIIAAGVVIATLLGWLLARLIARPLDRVAASAIAIASGDLEQRVATAGHDEVARVGTAFNHMAENLQRTISDLRGRRDELRLTLERLGAALGSTGAIEDMLPPILHAAATTLGARNGTLYRIGPAGGIVVAATTGDVGDAAVSRATSAVVSSGEPVLMDGDTVAAVPLRRREELIGVLALRCEAKAFDESELKTLATFAGQASVAIDNILLREEAEAASLTDPLTGVRNRRSLEQLLHTEVGRARRYGRPLSVLMADIDHFKAVNDRYGHAAGDRVLRDAAARIGAQIRGGVDTLARYGGEEFLIVLPEATRDGAAAVAAKVLAAFSSSAFEAGSGVLRLTVSVGVATLPLDARDASELIEAADRALYRAKAGGRNQVVVGSAPVGPKKMLETTQAGPLIVR